MNITIKYILDLDLIHHNALRLDTFVLRGAGATTAEIAILFDVIENEKPERILVCVDYLNFIIDEISKFIRFKENFKLREYKDYLTVMTLSYADEFSVVRNVMLHFVKDSTPERIRIFDQNAPIVLVFSNRERKLDFIQKIEMYGFR